MPLEAKRLALLYCRRKRRKRHDIRESVCKPLVDRETCEGVEIGGGGMSQVVVGLKAVVQHVVAWKSRWRDTILAGGGRLRHGTFRI